MSARRDITWPKMLVSALDMVKNYADKSFVDQRSILTFIDMRATSLTLSTAAIPPAEEDNLINGAMINEVLIN